MIKRIALCAMFLALTTTLTAQTYEVSLTKTEGLHLSSFQEMLDVVTQVTGKRMSSAKQLAGFVDQPRSTVSLHFEATEPLMKWFTSLGATALVPNEMYALGHAGGAVVFKVQGDQVVLRFMSAKVGNPLYVKVVAPKPKPPTPKVDPALLRAIIALLTDEQRDVLFELLRAQQEPKAVGEKSIVIDSDTRIVDDTYQFDEMLPSVDEIETPVVR